MVEIRCGPIAATKRSRHALAGTCFDSGPAERCWTSRLIVVAASRIQKELVRPITDGNGVAVQVI